MRIPFGLGSYQRADDRLPPFRLVNYFAERTPADAGQVVLLQRPGTVAHQDATGACRGLYRQSGVLSGDLLSVFDTSVLRGSTEIGTATGTDRVQWTYTVDGLRLLAGGVIHLVEAADVTAEDFPDDAEVSSLTSVNDILLASRASTQRIYYRLPGDTEWNALDFTAASAEPDDLVGLVELRGEVWAFGRSSVEVFYPTDNPTQPLQRADGRQVARGCKDRDSIAKLDNTLFWVGEDGNVYRGQDGAPAIVSNPAISERVSVSATAKAWTYALDGHLFYVLNLAAETLAYDALTGEWHQLKLYGRDDFVALGLFDGATTWLGDTDGILTFDRDAGADADGVIERIFTSAIPTERPFSADALDVLISPGTSPLGAEARVETRWSRDQGRTWSEWLSAELGTEGEYRTRARIRRLGMVDAPGRLFEHRITDDCIVRISGVDLNPALGGRSRP